ncbi:MAG: hypothetical protein ABFD91_16860 [Anaerohalosphaeraceae bacterium]
MKQPNEPNFVFSYTSVLSEAKNKILQNKANSPNFDLKMRFSAENKPNFNVAQASVLEGKSVSAPGGFHTFALCRLPFYFSTKQTQFVSWRLASGSSLPLTAPPKMVF